MSKHTLETVLFGLAVGLALRSAVAADTVLDVGKGVVSTNAVALLPETANVDKLIKRGDGTYCADCRLGVGSVESPFAGLNVEKGALVLLYGRDSTNKFCVGSISVTSGARLELRLEDRKAVINSLQGMSAITTPRADRVHLSVLNDAEGSFTGSVPGNVTIHYGKANPSGLSVFVHGVP